MSAWLTGLRSAHPPRLRRGCRGLARLARRGAGNNRPMSTATASSFLNAAGKVGRVTISERIEAARRERRVLVRVSRAGWRLEQAERERTWALVSARAPEDPDSGEDTELDGRDTIADRLSDEVSWLRECADWLSHLDADSYPPAVNLRPAADWPDRAVVAVDLARVAAVIDRIAADVDELARARRVQDLATAAVLADPRAERRRRLAEPDLQFRAFCTRRGCPLHRPRSWSGPGTPGRPSDTSAARSASGPATPTTRSGHANDHPVPAAFRKLDAVAVLMGRLLPAPRRASRARRRHPRDARPGSRPAHRRGTRVRLPGNCPSCGTTLACEIETQRTDLLDRIDVFPPLLPTLLDTSHMSGKRPFTGHSPRVRPAISRQRRPSPIHPGISSGSAPAFRRYPPGGDASAHPFASSSGPARSARTGASCPSPSWPPPRNARAGPWPRTAAS